MDRMTMLLVGHQQAAIEPLLRRNEAELRSIAERAGAGLRLAVRLDDDPLAGEAGGPRTIRPIHGLVEMTAEADSDAFGDAAADVAAALGNTIDWPASAAIVGVVREVLPAASDEILLVLGANRLPSIDRSRFSDYWLNTHAALAMSLLDDERKAKMGYQQLHADEDRSRNAATRSGAGVWTFDGVLACALAQIPDLPHLTVPGFAEAIAADETHFADQEAPMQGSFLRTLHTTTNGGS